ncbi:CHAT domain-containing protein [Isosphaeraceae bacterium EP7]
MKTITFWIGPKAGDPAAYPLEMRYDNGLVKKATLVASEVTNEGVLKSPGSWRGRELGGEDSPDPGATHQNKEFARWLYDLIFRGDIAAEWNRMYGDGELERCRFILEIEPDELRGLRLEQMGRTPIFPARLTNCSLVRGKRFSEGTTPFRDGTIRILVIVGSKERDESVLAEQELEALQKVIAEAIDGPDLRIIQQGSREEIAAQYLRFKPQILHFIGHGQLDEEGQPYLVLYDKTLKINHRWSLVDIDGDLGKHSPAFVFLNACHTVDAAGKVLDAAGKSDNRRAIGSISDWFLTRFRARAVLGMHAAVRGDAAGQLAGALYRAILDGEPMDVALTTARNKIDQLKGNDPNRGWDWAIPYLRVAVLPDQVLRNAASVQLCVQQADMVAAFKDNFLSIDRVDERGWFLEAIQFEPNSSKLVMVRGEKLVGKTDMIRCCLMSAARRSRLIKHVELDPKRGESFLSILRLLCEGEDDTLVSKPLPGRAMAKFYQVLNCVLDGNNPRDAQRLAGYPTTAEWMRDGVLRQLPRNGGDQEQVELLFSAFRESLLEVPHAAREDLAAKLREQGDEEAAGRVDDDTRPFLLVLDPVSLSGINSDTYSKFLVPYLFKPFALGKLPGLVFAMALQGEDYKTLTERMNLKPNPIDVQQIEAEKLVPLATDYLRRLCSLPENLAKEVDHEGWKVMTEGFAASLKKKSARWSPWMLKSLAGPYIGESLK